MAKYLKKPSIYGTIIAILFLIGSFISLQHVPIAYASPTGGTWISPTTDNNTYEPGVWYTIKVHAYSPAGVDYVNFTVEDARNNWHVICTNRAPDTGTSDVYSCNTDFRLTNGVYTGGGTIHLSFDVYGRDGSANKAPNGLRTENYKFSRLGGTWNTPTDGSSYHVGDHIRFSADAWPSDGGHPIDHVAFTANYAGSWHTVCTQSSPNIHEFGCDWYPPSNASGDVQVSFDVYTSNPGEQALAPNGVHTLHIQSLNTHPQLTWVAPADRFTIPYGNTLLLEANIPSSNDAWQIAYVEFRAWWPGYSDSVNWMLVCRENSPILYGSSQYGCDWNMQPVPIGILQVRADVYYSDGTHQLYAAPTHEGKVSQAVTNVINQKWAGYYVNSQNTATPSLYTDVMSSWTVTPVQCNGNGTGIMAVWVGIGGGVNDNGLEQTGTAGICTNGVPSYSGWWETPGSSDNNGNPFYYSQNDMPIAPGDVFTAEVQYVGNYTYVLSLTNKTRGISKVHWSTTTNQVVPDSADWIVEYNDFKPFLPHFADITMSACTANGMSIDTFRQINKIQAWSISNGTYVKPIRINVGDINSNNASYVASWGA